MADSTASQSSKSKMTLTTPPAVPDKLPYAVREHDISFLNNLT